MMISRYAPCAESFRAVYVLCIIGMGEQHGWPHKLHFLGKMMIISRVMLQNLSFNEYLEESDILTELLTFKKNYIE